ncbi:hypothetical protein MPLA_80045 [Mesorhizobium sp. ORS 3359]|nr:hypothetical protein MPLA_80045 [Mesorhizobium sp. ORS 3359]
MINPVKAHEALNGRSEDEQKKDRPGPRGRLFRMGICNKSGARDRNFVLDLAPGRQGRL